MNYFIITVDTEGDNLWDWKSNADITTRNSQYINGFQSLCEKYGYMPVYLLNYEMANSQDLLNQLFTKSIQQKCEIGMHLHAWNSPPNFELPRRFHGNPYITEYPIEIIYQKHSALKKIIETRYEVAPVSYRAGRWATNKELFSVLEDLGFLVDCSITPQIDLSHLPGMSVSMGNDYRDYRMDAFMIGEKLMEVPMTTRFERTIDGKSFKQRFKNLIKGKCTWMRPAVQTEKEMEHLVNLVREEGIDYIEFMIHSSELMVGGSPYSKTLEDTNALWEKIDRIYKYVSSIGYVGCTLKDYYYMHKNDDNELVQNERINKANATVKERGHGTVS